MKRIFLSTLIALLMATFGNAQATGPLAQSQTNSHFLVNSSNGKPVYLIGSGTWDDFQDIDQSASPAAFPFSTFVSMLVANGHNFTVLWHKDMPRLCSWQNGANWTHTQFPWPRNGPGNASDGNLKFDLSQFNQGYFDRLYSEVDTLRQNGIYAEVELFDTLDTGSYRCGTNTSPNGDGFPLTGANNINSVNDGYSGTGTCGVGAFTMTTNNAVTDVQDAYVKKVLDTLNDLPNVIYEVGEEMPGTSFSSCSGGWGGASAMSFFIPHMIGLVKTYEAGGTWEGTTYQGKTYQHLVGIGSMNYADRNSPQGDTIIYGSTAQWISPMVTGGSNSFPSNVSTNNQGKVVINDTDHALGPAAFVNPSTGAIDDVNLRGYIWENFTNGASGMMFLDPYIVYLPNNQRNPCSGQVDGICTGPMTKYNPFRAAMGYTQTLMSAIVNLLAMTPQPSLASSGFALVNNAAASSEFVVYSTAASSFTVNLSAQSGHTLNVQWLDPTSGSLTSSGTVSGGSSTQSFSPSWGNAHDSVLHLTGVAAVTLTGSINFGGQPIGFASTSQTATLTNSGGSTLNISSVSLTGADSAYFSIYQNNCGSTLGAGSSCTVLVTFTPNAERSFSANLTVATDAASSPDNTALAGSGVVPGCTMTGSVVGKISCT